MIDFEESIGNNQMKKLMSLHYEINCVVRVFINNDVFS